MRSDLDRLSDILAAIAKIKERVADRLTFQNDEMLQVWVIHHLQVIGEAARGVSQPEIVALRNILVHEYFGLNLDQIWMMTQKDLPKLKEQVRQIRAGTATDSRSSA
jgi:uncharacterized protein with HEPN domain